MEALHRSCSTLLCSKNVDADSKPFCRPQRQFIAIALIPSFCSYLVAKKQGWVDALYGCGPDRHGTITNRCGSSYVDQVQSFSHSEIQEEVVYWKLCARQQMNCVSVCTALVWQLEQGRRWRGRKWEVCSLGRSSEVLRVDCRAAQSRKQEQKEPYLVTWFPTVLVLHLLSLLYLINKTKFPRLNVYIKILCSLQKQLSVHTPRWVSLLISVLGSAYY